MTLLDAIADKKNRLDRLRPLPPEALSKLEHYRGHRTRLVRRRAMGAWRDRQAR